MDIDNSVLPLALGGGALCMFGFALYWGGLRLFSFFLGGSIGALLGLIIAYVANLEGTASLIFIVVGLFIGALLGWRFIRTLQRVIVFLIGLALGFLLGQIVLPSLDQVWASSFGALVASTLVGGLLAVLLFRYIIIFVTAAVGSYLLYQASGQTWVMGLSFLIGLVVQIGAFHALGLDKKIRKKGNHA
ncbi:MAG: hypothetical protein JXA37_06270 [Chloroflexia bacterium]|nr:hypothetical protein [Chloroflexia bacterium]